MKIYFWSFPTDSKTNELVDSKIPRREASARLEPQETFLAIVSSWFRLLTRKSVDNTFESAGDGFYESTHKGSDGNAKKLQDAEEARPAGNAGALRVAVDRHPCVESGNEEYMAQIGN